MIDALGLEVAAVRKRGGGSTVELRGGERVGVAEGSTLYRFVLTEELSLRDDTPIRVATGQTDVSGIVVSLRDGVLVVALEEDMGPKVASARLVANDSFLVERLKERLEAIREGKAEANQSAGERVLGLSPMLTGSGEPDPAALAGGGTLNEDQIAAVRQSLGSDTTFVWGPPGTGKTTTLARIVEAHYRAGRSVMLVSNTNIAVDTALERVAERLSEEPDFQQGLVIRQGPVVKEELRRKYGTHVILEEVVARVGAVLKREQEAVSQELADWGSAEFSLEAAVHDYSTAEQLQLSIAEDERHLARKRKSVAAASQEAHRQNSLRSRLGSDLERAKNMGSVRRLLTGLRPERIERDIKGAERAILVRAEEVRALGSEISALEVKIEALQQDSARLDEVLRTHPPLGAVRSKIAEIRKLISSGQERIGAIERELAAIEEGVLARGRILATTVYRTYLGKRATRQWDVVVIDEASMLMPPLVYYAAGLAKVAVVVAGDFRQLPPIVMSNDPLAEEWLKRDVFEIAGIPEAVAQRAPTPHLVALGTQYRMREPICDVINRLFYADKPLHSDPCVALGGEGLPFGAAPLLYVNTAQFHPWTALRAGTFSRYNLFHALMVRNIIIHLAEVGYIPPAGEVNDAVGVVSPYASQARLIQALLDDRLGARAAGIAATVHRFQGNEKKAMLIDLTDSYGARLGRFLQAVRVDEDGARLLNVAASRARHHVIVLGNFDFIRTKAPEGALVRHLLDIVQEGGTELDLDSLLPLADRDWVDGLHRVIPASFQLPANAAGAFTEGTFYPAFQQDVERARESVVILSPFATSRGTGRWADLLRSAVARGVRVRVLTRPSDEPGGGTTDEVYELVQALRNIGVTVDLRSRMHEKIAIIDGRILWHGSLNVLSHRDTHESMLRIESPGACMQVARFLTAPGGIKQDVVALETRENPDCPECGGPTVWKTGRFGVYFECERTACDGKTNARQSRRASSGRAVKRGGKRADAQVSSGSVELPCPSAGCGGRLVIRSGRNGEFLGCTKYPVCRQTQSIS